ncbi:pilus assembly protein [uncultured Methanobacterium sp.]|uniref:pilus assembly protein n=1 Tax=uncultured Methanobacterium sp. TaxID=176306 RepID=UPI002AA614CD|nr:pilus assembly protein [uncultured Methanobacterium sp.]
MEMNKINLSIYVKKIKMIRPEKNLKGCNLDWDTNWSIDYVKTDEKTLEYVCTLYPVGKMSLNFAIHGLIQCEDQNEDLEKRTDELSPLILNKSMETMVNILNETKDTKIQINKELNLNIADYAEINFNEIFLT